MVYIDQEKDYPVPKGDPMRRLSVFLLFLGLTSPSYGYWVGQCQFVHHNLDGDIIIAYQWATPAEEKLDLINQCNMLAGNLAESNPYINAANVLHIVNCDKYPWNVYCGGSGQ